MDGNQIDKLLRKWRKKSLWSLVGAESLCQEFLFGAAEIHKLLPHRSPFLFCQQLSRFADVGLPDSTSGLLCGHSVLSAEDPVFGGHFPDFPVYPGVLQLEMLGQLALCLGYFQQQRERLVWNQALLAPQDSQTLKIRASKVLGAHYLRPARPGQTLELLVCQLGKSDGLFAQMLGQVLLDGQVATICAQEVCFVD